MALAALAEREHTELARFIAAELERDDLSPRWRDALIVVSERVLFPDAGQRAGVARSLLRHALALRDAHDAASGEALWAAVWRYTTLIPAAELGTLLEFLRPSDAVATHQVALQSIANAFSRRLPDPALPLDELRLRVEALADCHIHDPELGSAEERALAVSAYCAAAVLGLERLGALTDQLVGRNKPWMTRRAHQRLAPVESEWSARLQPGELPPPALQGLREALRRLAVATQGTSAPSGGE